METLPLKILLADDDEAVRISLTEALHAAGHEVTEASDGDEALALASKKVFDVAICDVRMPKLDGVTLLRKIRYESPSTVIIIMTSYAAVRDAVSTLRDGAYDYVAKPIDCDEFTRRVIGSIAERQSLLRKFEIARTELMSREVGAHLVGESPAMARVRERIDSVAQSNESVVIVGEVGTGRTLIAQTMHARGPRRTERLVTIECAELEGQAISVTEQVDLAKRGTLYLREVDELPLPVQAEVWSALEGIGDVRVIASTQRDLKAMTVARTFREDLFKRMAVVDVHVAPLRERKEDLVHLVQYFLSKHASAGTLPPRLTQRAWKALSTYDFPGNVQELMTIIRRALVLARGAEIDLPHFPDVMQPA